MAKEAYYFSHDSNARHDPKIGAMRSVYGSAGYGWFWILVEMMRESEGYKLDMQGKYIFNAYAKQMDTECNVAEQFVQDCIEEFDLFSSDGLHFWSESLLRRMEMREQTSEKRRAAANVRWKKGTNDATSMQMHSKSNANGMQGKERKVKENKIKEIKEKEIEELDTAAPPILDIESIKDSILKLINTSEIKNYTLYDLDELYSYIGMVDVEVIEAAVKKGAGKQSIKYSINTLKGLIGEGITKKDQLYSKPAVGQAPSNVTTFGRGRGKPDIPIVNQSQGQAVSTEELEELRKLARKLDGEKGA